MKCVENLPYDILHISDIICMKSMFSSSAMNAKILFYDKQHSAMLIAGFHPEKMGRGGKWHGSFTHHNIPLPHLRIGMD